MVEPIKLGENEIMYSYYSEKENRFWEKQVLTINEVAKLLDCSTTTVSKLVKEHGLPCKKVGSLRLFSFYQVIAWVENNDEANMRNIVPAFAVSDALRT